MAKRQPGKVLEWVGVRLLTAAGTAVVTRTAVSLNLDDDEVAEIWHIDSSIRIENGLDGADQEVDAQMCLVMDPSYPVSSLPSDELVYQDLETFFTHLHQLDSEITTTGYSGIQEVSEKQFTFSPTPLLLATNPAMLTLRAVDSDVLYLCRIFFTRKKASGNELIRTLLKRR